MTLSFPNRDTLLCAISRGVIPHAIAAKPCHSAVQCSRIIVDFSSRIPKKILNELMAHGISPVDRCEDGLPLENWYRIFPLIASHDDELNCETLIEVERSVLPERVAELMRLGCDRVTMANSVMSRVFLRAMPLPYYVVLRAMEQQDAYREIAPQVWIEAGFTHPFAKRLTPPLGRWLLISNSQWRTMPTPVFEDLYKSLEIPIVAAEEMIATEPVKLISIPLKLVRSTATSLPQFWVCRDHSVIQRLAEESDSDLLAHLEFAVGCTPDGASVYLLRSRLGQLPTLILNAVSYSPFGNMPNLYLPVGLRLQPPLRRDVLVKLLADDPDLLTWLEPNGEQFAPQRIADAAFRPFSEWVEYVIELNRVDLQSWTDSAVFEFDSFVIAQEPPRTKTVANEVEAKPKVVASPTVHLSDSVIASVDVPLPVLARVDKSEWQQRCAKLEADFLSIEGPLDDPGRTRLWMELANANASLGQDRRHEAALCYANSARYSETANHWDVWFALEWENHSDSDLPRLISRTEATAAEVRTVAAFVLAQSPGNVVDLQRYFERNDRKLPVILAWHVSKRLAKLTGNDALGLARSRDRLLLRLRENGLNPQVDLPAFLRFSGEGSAGVRFVRDRMPDLHRSIREWASRSLGPENATRTLAYVDLFLAWGLGVLGEQTVCHELVESSRELLEHSEGIDEQSLIGTVLFRGFKHRIDEALAGRSLAGPLPEDCLLRLAEYRKRKQNIANSPYATAEYCINRMREQSLLLDPQERVDAFAETKRGSGPLAALLAELPGIHEPRLLMRTVRDAWNDGIKGAPLAEVRLRVLTEVLPLSLRAGFEFASEMLDLVRPSRETASSGALAIVQGRLLARAAGLARFLEQTDRLPFLIDAFLQLLDGADGETRFGLVNTAAPHFQRNLRNRDDLDRFVRGLAARNLSGNPWRPQQPEAYAQGLCGQLRLAAGWLALNEQGRAVPILDAARKELFSPEAAMSPKSVARVAESYLAACGSGPAEFAMERVTEFFHSLPPPRIRNIYTTAPYYSRLHLGIVEAAVFALVSDDSQTGQECRRWLDEDERLLRRQIHEDVRRLMNEGTA